MGRFGYNYSGPGDSNEGNDKFGLDQQSTGSVSSRQAARAGSCFAGVARLLARPAFEFGHRLFVTPQPSRRCSILSFFGRHVLPMNPKGVKREAFAYDAGRYPFVSGPEIKFKTKR